MPPLASLLASTRPVAFALPLSVSLAFAQAPTIPTALFGFRDFAPQARIDGQFLAVPDAALAGQHLKILTAEPHWASSPEDYKTALYVAEKFKAAGLQTEIVPYRVMLNKPVSILVEAFDASGKKLMSGPSPEHVDASNGGDPFQDDKRVTPAFNGSSPSGDVTGDVVYANHGTLADFKYLAAHGIPVKDKIVLVRYGENFRGVKVYIAQQFGARGVLIYSDPADDGYVKGDLYPAGPMRPPSAVQRGSTQFLPISPGDPSTPGIAATVDLPDSKRLTEAQTRSGPLADQPNIPANPLSYQDAQPILQALAGPSAPQDFQGGLPFHYHIGGTGAVRVHMNLQQDTALRTIWDVIGTIPGADPAQKDDWVVAGNHRDAWVYGAVDPNSGTAAMLESVHGLGVLLQTGWRPKRTIKICSWDAEEEGLIGSTEWAEDHAAQLAHAVAYLNTDVGVSGPDFGASAVPSLKPFVRDVTREVGSPKGGSVYDQWLKQEQTAHNRRSATNADPNSAHPSADAQPEVGTLGSGSDYTPFIQHLGVPSTDIGSDGPYGVYHSVFDNYAWFIKNADPTFVYEQQQARVFGLEILHMATADVLPYDYALYGREIVHYLEEAQKRAQDLPQTQAPAQTPAQSQAPPATPAPSQPSTPTLDFAPALAAADRFRLAGLAIHARQTAPPPNPAALNAALRAAESAFLSPAGLPKRPWFKHTIYAPGEFTGYAAVVIPGVNEALDVPDVPRAQTQLTNLTESLNRAAITLEQAAK